MVDSGKLSRKVINRRIGRIKRFFKWAVGEELVPPSVSQGLQAVGGLQKGRTSAHEAPPVRPAEQEAVEEILPFLSPIVAAMAQVQLLCGCRPGEIVVMRPCDLDRSDDVWIYSPQDHKGDWRERPRDIAIGPQAQAILKPFLDRSPEAYVVSPREAEELRNERRAEQRDPNRRTKIFPSELRRRERKKAAAKLRVSKRPKRERYDVDSYRRAIKYAIEKCNRQREADGLPPIDCWSPLQLRHSAGTKVRAKFGIEAAQVYLGHERADVTQVYAERNLKKTIEVAREMG